MDFRTSLKTIAAISLVLAVCCIVLAGCAAVSGGKSGATEKPQSTRSSASATRDNKGASDEEDSDSSKESRNPRSSTSTTAQDEGSTYEAADFKVTLPSSWGNNWKVNVNENRREAMNASNYAYVFEVDGQRRFSIECKKFELDSTAKIGSSGNCQVEFYPASSLSSDDETFIRSHIIVKNNSSSGTPEKETVSVPQNDYYKLSLPASLSDVEVKYEEGRIGGKTAVGATTTVIRNGSALFSVCCVSNDWGPQGTQGNVSIGSPSKAPSCTVYVIVPAQPRQGGGYDTQTAKADAKKYAAYVTLL